MKKTPLIALGLAAALAVATTSRSEAQTPSSYAWMIPCTSGCVYELLARAINEGMVKEGLASGGEFRNTPGPVGLANYAKLRGDAAQLTIVGSAQQGYAIATGFPVQITELTPIARMIAGPHVLVVPANSPHKTLADLAAAYKANPGSVAWGGGAVGTPSSVVAASIAAQTGGLEKFKFVPSTGGLQAVKAMLQGELTVASVQYAVADDLIRSGQVRALGISNDARIPGADIPTLREQGFDVEVTEWLGVMAPPEVSARDRAELQRRFAKLARSATWRGLLESNRWTSYFATGSSFSLFVTRQQDDTTRLLKTLGLYRPQL